MKNKRIRALYLVEERDGRADPGWDAYRSKRAAEEGAKQKNVGDHSIRKFVPVGSRLATRPASGPKNRRFSPLTLTEFDAIADGLDLDVGSEREKFIARFNRATDPMDETIGIRSVEDVTDTPPMTFDEFEAVADGLELQYLHGRKKFFKALGVFQAESALAECTQRPVVYIGPGPRELYEAYERTLGGDILPWTKADERTVDRYMQMSRILQEGVGNKAAFMKTVPSGAAPTVKHGPLTFREFRSIIGDAAEGVQDSHWNNVVEHLNRRFESWATKLPPKMTSISGEGLQRLMRGMSLGSLAHKSQFDIVAARINQWLGSGFLPPTEVGETLEPHEKESKPAIRAKLSARSLYDLISMSQNDLRLRNDQVLEFYDRAASLLNAYVQPGDWAPMLNAVHIAAALDECRTIFTMDELETIAHRLNHHMNPKVFPGLPPAPPARSVRIPGQTHDLEPWLKELAQLLGAQNGLPAAITDAAKALVKHVNNTKASLTITSGEQLYEALCNVREELFKEKQWLPSFTVSCPWKMLSVQCQRLLSAVASRQVLVPAPGTKSFQSSQAFVKPSSYHAELVINGVSVVTTALDISASDKLEVSIKTHRSTGDRNEADDFDVQRNK